ncbi:MAG: hypothetical protein QXU28_06070 [Nitrososphaerota archaeon]
MVESILLRRYASSLLGDGVKVLEKYVAEKLGNNNVWEVLIDEPSRFYKALRGFLGGGADAILVLIFMECFQYGVIDVEPRKLLEYIKSGEVRSLRGVFKKRGYATIY